MRKFFSIIFYFIFVIIVASIGFMVIVDPNQFKPQIEKLINKNNTYKVKLNGNIGWSILPTPGLLLEHANITDNKQQSNISGSKITISFSLLPLFNKKLQISNLHIEDAVIINKTQTIKLKYLNLDNIDFDYGNFQISYVQGQIGNNSFGLPVIDFDFRNIIYDQKNRTFNSKIRLQTDNQAFGAKLEFEAEPTVTIRNEYIDITQSNAKLNSQPIDFSGRITFAGSQTIINGNINIAKLSLNEQTIENLTTKVLLKQQRISLNPLDFSFVDSKHQAKLMIDFSSSTPVIEIADNIQGLDIAKFLNHFKQPQHASGTATLSFNLISKGSNSQEILKNLNGQGRFDANNGNFVGLDLTAILQQADNTLVSIYDSLNNISISSLRDLVSEQKKNWKDIGWNESKQTPFANMSVSYKITNGLLFNPDLLITHPEYKMIGSGMVDLSQQTIDYTVAANLVDRNKYDLFKLENTNFDILNFMRSVSLPIHVYGPIANPAVSPDKEKFLKQGLRFLQTRIVHHLKGILDKALTKPPAE